MNAGTTNIGAEALASALLKVVQSGAHKAVSFTDLSQVPPGSSGYLTPSGLEVVRCSSDDSVMWRRSATGRPYTITDADQVFTSWSGPANDMQLFDCLLDTLADAGIPSVADAARTAASEVRA